MKTILGREPSVFFELVSALLLAAVVLVPAPAGLTVALNATITAAASLATAATLPNHRDRVLPSLLSFVRALFAVWVGLGLPLAESTQAGLIGLVSAAAALFVRGQVTAPLPADPPPGPRGKPTAPVPQAGNEGGTEAALEPSQGQSAFGATCP